MTGPTSSETIKRPSSGVIHFRYAVDPLRPWEGLGPLQSASATGTLMGALEQRLGEESAAPSALLLPIPADGGDGGEGIPWQTSKPISRRRREGRCFSRLPLGDSRKDQEAHHKGIGSRVG